MTGRRGGPGGSFPLDGAFDDLRKVVESVAAAFAPFVESVRKATDALGAAATSATKETKAAGAAAGGTAKEVDKLATSQDKAARSSMRLRDALRDTSGAASGLQRALASGGTLAKMFGFDEAGQKLAQFSQGLGAVKDLVTGIVAAGPALTAIGAIVGVVVAGVGAIQEGVRQGTGETLTLTNTIAGAVLAVADTAQKAFAKWRVFFSGIGDFVRDTFTEIGTTILNVIGDALFSISVSFQTMAARLTGSTNPAVRALGEAFREAADAALEARGVVVGASAEMAKKSTEAARQSFRDQRQILADMANTTEGIQTQLNVLFDASSGKGKSLFREPIEALKQLLGDLQKLAEKATGTTEAAKPKEVATSPTEALSAGRTTGVEYTSGLLEEIEKSKSTINAELLEALTVDPNDGKVISSFRDLWKNIGNLLRSNPIGFLGGIFGGSGVGGAAGGFSGTSLVSGGGGFAQGGEVGSRGAVPSLAHFSAAARGFATGGIAPSDTVPAWLTPGEFVQPLRAVRAYGPAIMEAIRQVRIPPAALQNIASGYQGLMQSAARPFVHFTPRGYADGGSVDAGAGGDALRGSIKVLPVMVPDKAEYERIVHGGRSAILQLFSSDPDFRALRSQL